jgi:hypothetical protein
MRIYEKRRKISLCKPFTPSQVTNERYDKAFKTKEGPFVEHEVDGILEIKQAR